MARAGNSRFVIPGLVPGIHLSACSGVRRRLDPGDKRRDDAEGIGSPVQPRSERRQPAFAVIAAGAAARLATGVTKSGYGKSVRGL